MLNLKVKKNTQTVMIQYFMEGLGIANAVVGGRLWKFRVNIVILPVKVRAQGKIVE